MADHLALDETRLVGDEDHAAAVARDLPVALHGAEATPVPFLLLLGDPQPLGQALLGYGDPFVGQYFQDSLTGGDFRGIRLQALGFDGQSSAHLVKFLVFRAQMAELVDAPVSGTGGSNPRCSPLLLWPPPLSLRPPPPPPLFLCGAPP